MLCLVMFGIWCSFIQSFVLQKITKSYLIIVFKDFIIKVLFIFSAVQPGVLTNSEIKCAYVFASIDDWYLWEMCWTIGAYQLKIIYISTIHVICANIYVMVGFKTKAQLWRAALWLWRHILEIGNTSDFNVQ